MKMFALVTTDGTAAAETALCGDCLTDNAAEILRRANSDIDKARDFVDCTGNDALVCVSCGKA